MGIKCWGSSEDFIQKLYTPVYLSDSKSVDLLLLIFNFLIVDISLRIVMIDCYLHFDKTCM